MGGLCGQNGYNHNIIINISKHARSHRTIKRTPAFVNKNYQSPIFLVFIFFFLICLSLSTCWILEYVFSQRVESFTRFTVHAVQLFNSVNRVNASLWTECEPKPCKSFSWGLRHQTPDLAGGLRPPSTLDPLANPLTTKTRHNEHQWKNRAAAQLFMLFGCVGA